MAVRVTLNREGVRQLLRSPRLQAELLRRASNVARAAGPGMEPDSGVGPNRARASVRTVTVEAMLAEQRERRLTRAIDAARQ